MYSLASHEERFEHILMKVLSGGSLIGIIGGLEGRFKIRHGIRTLDISESVGWMLMTAKLC